MQQATMHGTFRQPSEVGHATGRNILPFNCRPLVWVDIRTLVDSPPARPTIFLASLLTSDVNLIDAESNTTSRKRQRQRQRQLTRLSGRMTRIDPAGHASIAWNAFIRSSCNAARWYAYAIDTKQRREWNTRQGFKMQHDTRAQSETQHRSMVHSTPDSSRGTSEEEEQAVRYSR